MRHKIYGKQLNRDSEHRRAMLRNLAAGLFEHGEIRTTMPKAKAVQPFIEKIITIAKKGDLSARRRIEQLVNDRKIHSWVADDNVPDSKKDNDYFDLPDESDIQVNRYGEVRKAPRLVQHILRTVAPLFDDRNGGYTRIVKTGKHRLGDGGDIVVLQLVGQEDGPEIGGGTSRRRQQADRRAAFAASLRKAGSQTPVADVEEMTDDQVVEAAVDGTPILDAEIEESAPDAGSKDEDKADG